MKLVIILFLCVFVLYTKGQTTQLTNYYCYANDDTVEFRLYTETHSAWNLSSNCSLESCNIDLNDTNHCLSTSTPCFNYSTIDNSSVCAPGILCSILEPCDNTTYTCTLDTSVCVINSCCSSEAVCLPLSVLNFCQSESITTVESITSEPLTSSTQSTSSSPTSEAELTSSSQSEDLTSSSSSTESATSSSSSSSSTDA